MSGNRERWAELEKTLLAVLAQMSSDLDERNHELLSDFIENREFEVALTWLNSLVEERGITISSDTRRAMDHAKSLMTSTD